MKRFARFCTALMMLVMVFCFAMTAYADGSVVYNENANKFIFSPGTTESPTSLFQNFRNVMPGDTLTEQILIKNKTSNKVKIKVYMRSLGAQEHTDDFLSRMNLTVKQKEENVLFAAPADERAQLTDWVYLGTVYSGGNITLDVIARIAKNQPGLGKQPVPTEFAIVAHIQIDIVASLRLQPELTLLQILVSEHLLNGWQTACLFVG